MRTLPTLAAALLFPMAAHAACPERAVFPASFSYDVKNGRHVAVAAVLLPAPVATIAPIAEAVEAAPTWTNLAAQGSIPQPVALTPLLESGKLDKPELHVDATTDGACPGATRVTASFEWGFATLARMLGGDAKDLPALFALAVRDEVIARAMTTPEGAAALAGLQPGNSTLLRVVPTGLVLPGDRIGPMQERLQALGAKGGKADLGDALAAFLDCHRQATSLAGFGALTSHEGTPTVVRPDCATCAVSYSITATREGEKSISLAFGLGR